MNLLCLNGAHVPSGSADLVTAHVADMLATYGATVQVVSLREYDVPLFTFGTGPLPPDVALLLEQFYAADGFVWLTPMYHGGMTGALKNLLDWLEYLRSRPAPYLSGKTVGLVAFSDGQQTMQAINSMADVAHALRATTLPYSVPIHAVSAQVLKPSRSLSVELQHRLSLLAAGLVQAVQAQLYYTRPQVLACPLPAALSSNPS